MILLSDGDTSSIIEKEIVYPIAGPFAHSLDYFCPSHICGLLLFPDALDVELLNYYKQLAPTKRTENLGKRKMEYCNMESSPIDSRDSATQKMIFH